MALAMADCLVAGGADVRKEPCCFDPLSTSAIGPGTLGVSRGTQ